MGKLYLVSTPIGNLDDLTHRAARVLSEVPLIAAEDTRTTKKLLAHYGIQTRLTAFHDHNKEAAAGPLVDHLESGDLALVSDAGTPAINDPGYYLVAAALQAGHSIIPIPGPSAPIAALSASGLATDSFLYLGYLPRKSNPRQALLQDVSGLPWTLVCLETPHRLLDALNDCLSILGDREIAVARELTKLHEEFFRGRISQAQRHFQGGKIRGEITLVIAGKGPEGSWTEERLIKEIRQEMAAGKASPSQLAKKLAKDSGWPRGGIYDLILDLEKQEED
jgi:16S rRNA (cytidine1402-2'-O)-methyltransferase